MVEYSANNNAIQACVYHSVSLVANHWMIFLYLQVLPDVKMVVTGLSYYICWQSILDPNVFHESIPYEILYSEGISSSQK